MPFVNGLLQCFLIDTSMSSKKGLNFELRLLQRINCQIITSKNCKNYKNCLLLSFAKSMNSTLVMFSLCKKRFIKHLVGAFLKDQVLLSLNLMDSSHKPTWSYKSHESSVAALFDWFVSLHRLTSLNKKSYIIPRPTRLANLRFRWN